MCKQFEKALAFHCSPALFGIKPSNLINLDLKDYPNLEKEIEELNRSFNPRISFKILKISSKNALVLVYQERKLYRAIFNTEGYEYLLNYDYPKVKDLNAYIECLKERIIMNDFPHEIGVFLGYDLDDIKEYQKGNKNCLMVGYWKVFSDKEKKMKIFNQYTRCKNIVSSLLNKGYRLEAII